MIENVLKTYSTPVFDDKHHAAITVNDHEKLLFTMISHGNEEAFCRLFHLYSPLFSAVIKKITKDETIVADIIQEAFLRIWQKRETLSHINCPRSWALQIVYNISFNWLRHQKIHLKVNSFLKKNYSIQSNQTEEMVILSDVSRILKNAIHQLPPQTQKIYRLNHDYGLRVAEIAQEMHLSQQTIKNTLGRALKEIRNHLQLVGVSL